LGPQPHVERVQDFGCTFERDGQGGGQDSGAVITTTMMIMAPPAIIMVALRA